MKLLQFVIVGILLVGIAKGQGVTTGSITGKVVEVGTSTPLVGATVTAVHEPTGAKYGAIVKKGGRYTIRGMRVGAPYTITATYVGYKKSVRNGASVSLGSETEYDFQLQQSTAATNEVLVTANQDRVFNTNKNGSGSTVSESEIAAAPTINRSLSDIARINPYSSQSTTFGGDDGLQGITVAGTNSRFNNIQIDGAVANDVFGLGAAGTAGSQANANVLSLDAIQELQVNVSPYDIRQSGFTGGLVNAITRGGTNKTTGSVFLFGRNEKFVGVSPDALKQPYSNFSDFQFGGRIGGSIVDNTLFYHVTTEVRMRNRPLELGLNNPNALNNFPHSKSDIEEVANVAKEVYGYDAGNADPFISRNNSYNVIGRIDWNINENHKLQLRHNYTNAFQDRNVQRTPQIFSLSSQWNEFRSINNSTVLQLNSLLGDNVSNEFRIAYNITNDERALQANPFPQVKVYVASNDYVLLGPERSSQANALDQTQLAITNDVSFFLENHTLTIGTHNELYTFNNLFIQDYFGTYAFKDLQAFKDKTPSFYQLSYANTAATNGELKPRANWDMAQVGFYVMDDFKLSENINNLKFTLGFRVDAPVYLSKPLENSLFKARFDSLEARYTALSETEKRVNQFIPAGMATSVLPDVMPMFAPRFGFNYDVFADKTFQIRGGTGIFTGRVAAVWLSNQYSNTGVDFYRIAVGADNSTASPIVGIDGKTPLQVNLDPLNPPVPGDGTFAGSNEKTTVVNVLDKNFKMPQVWRSTLGSDVKITSGLSWTVEGMYSENFNTVDYANLNLKRSAIFANSLADGRPLFARNPTRTVNDSVNVKEFTQVIYLTSRNVGYQYSFMSSLNLDSKNDYVPGLSAMLSYTFSKAYDLSDATSSVALSNWQNTDTYDPNNNRIGTSNFDVPHRFNANISYRFELLKKYQTTLGVFYSGNSGRPYGFTYVGDLNGDGVTHNDLIYVPKQDDLNKTVVVVPPGGLDLRTSEQIWNQLMSFIDANPVLKSYQGQVLPRNAMREPFVHQLDIRIAQQIPTFDVLTTKNVEFTLDIQNFLNLLNSECGQQRFVNFQSFQLINLTNDTNGTPFDPQGRMRMSFSTPTVNGRPGVYTTDNFFSRWRMQAGIRVNF